MSELDDGDSTSSSTPIVDDDAGPAFPRDPAQPSRFEAAAMQLALVDDPLVHLAAPDAVALRWPSATALVVAGGIAERASALKPVVAPLVAGGLVIVVVDGDDDDVAALKRLLPPIQPTRAHVVIARDGALDAKAQKSLGKHPVAAALAAPRPVDVDRFHARVDASRDAVADAARFADALKGRPVWATTVIASAIAVAFAGELLLSATSFPPALIRMGALVPARVHDGELWRLLSPAFLHGGWMHVLFNTYIFVLLGRPLERLLGTPRLVVLFTASALGGSLLSMQFLDARHSVGASGAVWGLMAAQAAIVFWKTDLVSPLAVPAARKAALQALGLNAVYSLTPGVDWAAHAGGGVVGAVLVGSGIITAGVPSAARRAAVDDTPSTSWRVAAGVATLALAASALLAIVSGRPHELAVSPTLVDVTDTPLDVTFAAPHGAARRVEHEAARALVVVGDILHDGYVAVVVGDRYDTPLTDEGLAAEREGLRSALATPLPNTTAVGGVDVRPDADGVLVVARLQYDNGVPAVRVFHVSPDRFVSVMITHFATLPWSAEELAIAMARSARARPASGGEHAPDAAPPAPAPDDTP